MGSNVPDKLMDSLPKAFLVVIIFSGLVICVGSPFWLLIRNWLPQLMNSQSLENTISAIAILLVCSLVAGIGGFLFETPLLGDNGFYHWLRNKLVSKEKREVTPQGDETKYLWLVSFHNWLYSNGCPQFLDDMHLKNAIINALIVGFSVSLGLNIVALPYFFLVSYPYDWSVTAIPINALCLVSLLYYNTVYWKPEKQAKLKPLAEEFQKFIEEKEKERKRKGATQSFLGYEIV
jgi:hypothetical protein